MIRSTVWLADGEVITFDMETLADAIQHAVGEYYYNSARMDFERVDDTEGGDS